MSNKKHPLISVVMLNYNGLKYLKRTIPPILKLDYPNYEFIIVDNGSTDGGIEFIKKFKKKIKLIENGENLGYSKGKNIGVKHANGEYILLLDNDILLKSNKKILYDILNHYTKDICFIQIPLLDIDKNRTNYYGIYSSIYGTNNHKKDMSIKKLLYYKKELVEIMGATGGFLFFKKKAWDDIGGLDESQKFNLDDFDIGQRAWIFGYKNYLYTKDYVIHLGIKKTESATDYSNRFSLFFSGHARSMIKNYKIINLIFIFPIFIVYINFKALKYSIIMRNISVFFALLSSVNLFLKNLPDTLKQRKIIQSKRVVKDDVFLKIKPPKFD